MTMMNTIHPPLFTIVDLVLIDDKEKNYIIEIRGELGDLFFKVLLFCSVNISECINII